MKINPKEFYDLLYKKLERVTPLEVDCGKLCGGACCEVTDEITGMYLFPFEECEYNPPAKWSKIYDTDFEWKEGKTASLFTCDGSCERDKRPLSCRIFPLVPYVHRGEKMRLIMDPRGKGICPLASVMEIKDLDAQFVKQVYEAMLLCMKIKECREFIYALTESIDEEKTI